MFTGLYLWRKRERLTQHQAAEKLGISETSYRLIESGRLQPSARQWDGLRSQFGREADHILEFYHVTGATNAE